jgi:endoribonuclease Dicer
MQFLFFLTKTHSCNLNCIIRRRYSSGKPNFEFVPVEGGGYECKLTLPPNAAFHTIVGPSGKDVRLAKSLVCLEACKKLHQMGALNTML